MLTLHEIYESALVDLKAGRPERAAGGLLQVLAAWPDHADTWYYLGQLSEQRGRMTEAALCYHRAAEAPEGHEAAREGLARLTERQRSRADALLGEGKPQEAAEALGEAWLLGGGAPPEALRRLAQARIGDAQAGRPSGAHLANFLIWTVREGLERIRALQSADRPDDAAYECYRLLALKPDLPPLLEQLRGIAEACIDDAIQPLMAAGRLVDAARLLERALRFHPDRPKTVRRREELVVRLSDEARSSEQEGRARDAVALLRAALRLSPDSPPLIQALGRVKASVASRVERSMAAAADAARSGDAGGAVRRYAEAASLALDPRPAYTLLTEARFRAVTSSRGILAMPGVGLVEFANAPHSIRLRRQGQESKGVALVAFHREPLLFDDGWEHFQVTSINWESREVCRLLLGLGYAVDAVGMGQGPPPDAAAYDLTFSLGGFLARHRDALPSGARHIVLATGSDPTFQNRAETDRIQALQTRRAGRYAPKRQIADPADQLRALKLADHRLLIGNAVTRDTYPEALRSRFELIRVTASETAWRKTRDEYLPEAKEFLWYFGHGAVLKGLDLVLDAFAGQERWTLNVVGHVAYEPDFDELYFKELYRHPRIRVHGHLRGDSPVLAEVCRRSFCFIAPSASEGMSNAVATCLQIGLYPVLSRNTGIDLPAGCGLYLPSLTPTAVADAVATVAALPDGELSRQIRDCQTAALAAYSRASYTEAMTSILARIATAPPPAR